ncbi:MAG: chemotaxis protein CheW, partial [Gorillibacterium sp.]|nr:chemotaxis protein CheW [Gorillibacterium sp.]
VPLRPLPGVGPALAGLLDRGGIVMPVVDLSVRLGGPPTPSEHLSTRIIVTNARYEGREVPLGLIAEQVTELAELPGEFCSRPAKDAPAGLDCLGPVLRIGTELVQWIDVDRVLTPAELAWMIDVVLGDSHGSERA